MDFVLHTSDSRGYANHGWLEARHSFSFAGWYDSKKVHFGALRVLNDDIIAPGKGFGEHPHNNMEIITIPLHGELEHKDSMGNLGVIRSGEVQVMSAGSGIFHSEFNASTTDNISLFQIWIFPNKTDVSPRYDQIEYKLDPSKSQLIPVVCPKNKTGTKEQTWIHQEAWISLGNIIKTDALSIDINTKGNGFYIIVIDGIMNIINQQLEKKDAIGIWNTDQIKINTNSSCSFLLIEVPMLNF